jgi:hypothetical protein
MQLSPETIADLDVAPVVQALGGHERRRERFVTTMLTESPSPSACPISMKATT